jgi:uncharacterized protein YoxC
MSTWMQIILALCAIAVTVVVIPAIVSLRRSVQRAETVLAAVERELPALVTQTEALMDDVRALVRQSNRELERLGTIVERVGDVSEKVARLVGAVSGFTRVGQLVGAAAGIKKGVDVFIQRLRTHGGH